MKKISKLLFVASFISMTIPAWGQASTEGKEFWLASTIICQPPSASAAAVPYIAVSAQKPCDVYIFDYQGNQLANASVDAGSWTEFGNVNNTNTGPGASPNNGPINYNLDPTKWYPSTNVVSAAEVYKHADKTNNFGLHITATENISVFVIIRATNSMDASNILPVTALRSEYYTQDYWPNAKDVSNNVTMTTILATEDNTVIDITPTGNTYGKSNANTTFDVTLNKGQTYYLMSSNGEQLKGTHIKARYDKPIAVYNGCPLTRIPYGISARDGIYEQSMPIDYWGTQFIVTRSMHKDGNIIGITATENGTWIKIDGITKATINAGDTYYFMLQSQYDPNSKQPGDKPINTSDVFTADVVYVETRCPAAVFSYDTGNSFVYGKKSTLCGDDIDENENQGCKDDRLGDPTSVWISPLQQKIKHITFGACYTDKTEMHYLNVVTETEKRDSTILTAYNINTPEDHSSQLNWELVPGNPKYSYARVLLTDHNKDMRVFTLYNPSGFIGHVYGNGDDEAYAYSVGSAAVEYGVVLEDETCINGSRSNEKYCLGVELNFDATVGTDSITSVNWDFGDGITETGSSPITTHKYNSPGWYDVTAELYGSPVCSGLKNQYIATVTFTFRVWQPKTKMGTVQPPICIEADSTLDGRKLTAAELQDLLLHGKNDTVIPNECYEDTIVNYVTYGLKTKDKKYGKDTIGYDQIVLNGTTYKLDNLPPGDIVEWTETNQYGCDSLFKYHVIIRTCLDIDITNPDPATQYTCLGEPLPIHYEIIKGEIDGNAVFTIDELPMISKEITIPQTPSEGWIDLPVEGIQKPGHYHGHITVKDRWCPNTFDFPLDIVIRYPNDVFKFKFYNVLAVRQDAGYNFIHYQWYINNQPVGGDVSVLYLGEDVVLQDSDVVYVKLTDQNGMVLESCPQTNLYEGKPIKPNKAPVQKIIKNQRMYILRDEQIYDMFGREVK